MKSKRFFRKISKINYPFIIILIGLVISGLLLSKACFFKTYDFRIFNNVLTPIATILAFIIYYATLIEIKDTNNRTINFQKINLFKERIENFKIRLESSQIHIPVQFQKMFHPNERFNLTSFFKVYKIVHKEMRDEIEKGETDVMDLSMFIFSLCFDFKLHFNHIESLIEEIQESDFDKLEKSTLNETLVKLLNDYLYINDFGEQMMMELNYTNSKKQTIKISGYDAPFHVIPTNKLTTIFTHMNFNRIYRLMKKNKMI